jgi:hypothetical protein
MMAKGLMMMMMMMGLMFSYAFIIYPVYCSAAEQAPQ